MYMSARAFLRGPPHRKRWSYSDLIRILFGSDSDLIRIWFGSYSDRILIWFLGDENHGTLLEIWGRMEAVRVRWDGVVRHPPTHADLPQRQLQADDVGEGEACPGERKWCLLVGNLFFLDESNQRPKISLLSESFYPFYIWAKFCLAEHIYNLVSLYHFTIEKTRQNERNVSLHNIHLTVYI